MAKGDTEDERTARLAAALKANLGKRKAQAKARQEASRGEGQEDE